MLAMFDLLTGSAVPQTHLFASHRYYIWAYEKALREECGYRGYQPVSPGLMLLSSLVLVGFVSDLRIST